jgi:hypothetical protein
MRDYGITNAAPYAAAPAVGAAGDTYFNSTEKALYLSDGTSWLGQAGRCIARKSGGPAGGTLPASGATWLTLFTVTATIQTGRLYEIRFTCRAITPQHGMNAIVRRDGVDGADGSGTQWNVFCGAQSASGYNFVNYAWQFTGTGTHTWTILGQSQDTSTAVVYAEPPSFCAIYDLGFDPGSQ